MNRVGLSLLLLLTFQVSVAEPQTQKISLDDVLKLAEESSETVQAIDQEIEALESEIASRDLLLSPTLTSELSFSDDRRRTLTPNSRRTSSSFLDTTLAKPFSTGTTASLNFGQEVVNFENANGEQSVADWELRLSQSLWRDAFGRSTRLRRDAEEKELLSRRLSAVYERQQFLVEVESAYWDLVLAEREREIQLENIKRSQMLVTWARDRVRRSAAEAADLYQVQALLSQRQLELISIQNRIDLRRNQFRQLIPSIDPANWSFNLGELNLERAPVGLVEKLSSDLDIENSVLPVRLDALASRFGAEQADFEARRVADNLNPALNAFVAYGSNGVDSRGGEAWAQAARSSSPAASVGLTLSMELDLGLKEKRRQSARMNAAAAETRAQALQRSSQVGWVELQRNVENLQKQVKEAQELFEIQTKKVRAERIRYEQGRSTAFQMTTFETDAAQSELRLSQLQAELRKAESAARLYTASVGN